MNTDAWDGWQAFSDAARKYLESVTVSPPANATAQFADFLREQFQRYARPWAATHAMPPPETGLAGPLTEAPAFGATREHQQRAQRMVDATRRMAHAQHRLQRLWSDLLRDAATKFVSQLSPMPAAAATTEGLRKLYDHWIDCAEDAYARVAHSEEFCRAQADFVNAASQWRHEQQTNMEYWSKLFDLPTRSEINSLTRRLRTLEQQLQAATRVTAAASRPAKVRAAQAPRARAKKKRS